MTGTVAESDPEIIDEIELDGGRVLVVRRAEPDDAPRLYELYERLSTDDRYLRFFSGFHPPLAFLHDWIGQNERGGLVLVAICNGEIVADAGYSRLGDGDAEFALTVAPKWRGWLGPYLLDLLVDQAEQAGLDNLQAEILLANAPMLALVRARGFAVCDHPDATEVRIAIGTHGRTPTWPPDDPRPRVLVEARSGRWIGEEAARTAGLLVRLCPGPGSGGDVRSSRRTCPVVHGKACPLVAGADAVVHLLPGPAGEDVLRGIRGTSPDVPVIVARSGEPLVRFGACSPGSELMMRLDALLAGHS